MKIFYSNNHRTILFKHNINMPGHIFQKSHSHPYHSHDVNRHALHSLTFPFPSKHSLLQYFKLGIKPKCTVYKMWFITDGYALRVLEYDIKGT